jgi:hypothetical protein
MRKLATFLPAILLLHACGGGGSGGGAPPPAAPVPPPATQQPAFSIPSTVALTADAGVGANPIARVDATANVPLTDTQRGAFTMTSNGLENVFFSPRQDLSWETIFYFKDPSEIGPGVYVDTIRVGLCTDTNCTALRSDTISTVTVTYTVTGTVPPPPGVEAATTSVTATSMAYTDEQPRVRIPLTYLHERANRSFSATTSSAYVGALNSQVINATPAGAELEITFRYAWNLAPGVYDDVITVDVCSRCPTPVVGSPLTIQTRYTVTDTAGGPNGYRIRFLPHAARELAWDSNSQRLYLAVPASATANGSSLVALNPQSGAVTGSVNVGMDPSQLAVSADGSVAYVASGTSNLVRRFVLPALTPDQSVTLGTGPSGERAARDIQVSQFDPGLLAVERQVGIGDGNGLDIALIANGVLRPDTVPLSFGQQLYGVQWVDATHLYALSAFDRAVATITVTAGEITAHSFSPLAGWESTGDGRSHWDGSFYYRDGGLKIDVEGARMEGIYAPQSPGEWVRGVVPDATLNRLFALVAWSSQYQLRSYTLDTRQPIASVPLVSVPFELNSAPQLIRFGSNGLAASTTDGRVMLVEGAFVAP